MAKKRTMKPALSVFLFLSRFNVVFSQTQSLCRDLDQTKEYWCPVDRYCEWDSFPLDEKIKLGTLLGYNRQEWNYQRINPVEFTAYADLGPTTQRALLDIGE